MLLFFQRTNVIDWSRTVDLSKVCSWFALGAAWRSGIEFASGTEDPRSNPDWVLGCGIDK
jgi:hypothetical protein